MQRLCKRIALLFSGVLLSLFLIGCASGAPTGDKFEADVVGRLELAYATQYDVAYLADGTCLLTVGGTDRYLLVPEGQADDRSSAPTAEGITCITCPIRNAYLATSSSMDFFRQLGSLGSIRLTSTKSQDWSLPEVVTALDHGDMRYAGKYSTPDYELLLAEGTELAIESTMISHAPEVAERISALGIPVLVERSSYEASPLGRLEWIKLYGLLTEHLDEAQKFFDEQVASIRSLSQDAPSQRPAVAFFSLSSNGHAVVRKPGDYVSQMIDLAGGRYFLQGEESDANNALSTMNMEMERFYQEARDADVVIYNSAIDDELHSIDDLVAKSSRLADFTAVRNDNVWCTGKDLFQQPTCAAQLIAEMNAVFAGWASDAAKLEHLYRVHWRDAQ